MGEPERCWGSGWLTYKGSGEGEPGLPACQGCPDCNEWLKYLYQQLEYVASQADAAGGWWK